MTTKPKPSGKPEVLNPRYAGATPEMVGRALMRPVKPMKRKSQKAATAKRDIQSSI